MWKPIADRVFATEHQEPSECEPFDVARAVSPERTDLPQEPRVFLADKRVVRAPLREDLPIAPDAFGVEVSRAVAFQDLRVPLGLRVCEHPPCDVAIGDAVTLVHTQKRLPLPGSVQMNRTLRARRLRHTNEEHRPPVDLDALDVIQREQVGAHLLRVL